MPPRPGQPPSPYYRMKTSSIAAALLTSAFKSSLYHVALAQNGTEINATATEGPTAAPIIVLSSNMTVDWTGHNDKWDRYCGPKTVGGHEIAKKYCSPQTACGLTGELTEGQYGMNGNDCNPRHYIDLESNFSTSLRWMCFTDIRCIAPTVAPSTSAMPSSTTMTVATNAGTTGSSTSITTIAAKVDTTTVGTAVVTPVFTPSMTPVAGVTIPPTSAGTTNVGAEPMSNHPTISGPSRYCVNIEFLTDNFPKESGFSFISSDGEVIFEQTTGSMTERDTSYTANICDLLPGSYDFVITDGFGDGICCTDGNTGKYVVDINGHVILVGGRFKAKNVTHGIIVGYNANLTDKDQAFLDAHNERRKKYHELKGVSYRPMAWSPDLAAGASKYVDEAVKTCVIAPQGGPYGFNIANEVLDNEGLEKVPGNAVNIWAGDKWYSDNSTYPENLSFTAVVWRSALYVGCATKTAQMENSTKWCQFTLCRYARTPNCGVDKSDWITPTLDENPLFCNGMLCPETSTDGTLFDGHCHT